MAKQSKEFLSIALHRPDRCDPSARLHIVSLGSGRVEAVELSEDELVKLIAQASRALANLKGVQV